MYKNEKSVCQYVIMPLLVRKWHCWLIFFERSRCTPGHMSNVFLLSTVYLLRLTSHIFRIPPTIDWVWRTYLIQFFYRELFRLKHFTFVGSGKRISTVLKSSLLDWIFSAENGLAIISTLGQWIRCYKKDQKYFQRNWRTNIWTKKLLHL